MNPGWQLLLVIVGTIGAAIAVVHYRDLIFPQATPPRRSQPAPARQSRRHLSPRRPAGQPSPAKQTAKPTATISRARNGYVMADNDAEMIAFLAIAKLIRANMITETAALATVFNVKAGSSKAYQDARSKLKKAQDLLEHPPTIAA